MIIHKIPQQDLLNSIMGYGVLYSNGVLEYKTRISQEDISNSVSISNIYYNKYCEKKWQSYNGNIIENNENILLKYSKAYWFFNLQNIFACNCGNNVTNMAYTYYKCDNLTGSPVCGDNVVNMTYTYYQCYNLTGSPVCGNNVIDMSATYNGCSNLTGSPVCGNSVIGMYNTYRNCKNLTGSPACGNNVIYMYQTYYNCQNLTGSPVCGDNVIYMAFTYGDCYNLTGTPVCGPNVTNMYSTYCNCYNLSAGNQYWYSKNVNNIRNCFRGKNNSRRYNIHCYNNSKTLNTLLINNTRSIVGTSITWTNAGTYYYNAVYNIYIYPDMI